MLNQKRLHKPEKAPGALDLYTKAITKYSQRNYLERARLPRRLILARKENYSTCQVEKEVCAAQF